MNIALTAAACVGGELVLTSVAKRCLMYKMNSMGDQMCGLIWNLAQLGFTSAIRNSNNDATISGIVSGVDRNRKIPKTLLYHPNYEILRESDLAGSISFVYKIMLDKRRKIAHQHYKKEQNTSNLLNQSIITTDGQQQGSIETYFQNNLNTDAHGNEWECHSPLCTESFREIFDQLEESANIICQQIVNIRREHAKYAQSYKVSQWIFGIHDDVYWNRLKSELPVLDKRINRFLTAIPWCTLISNESNANINNDQS